MRFRSSVTVLRLACALALGALTGVQTADAQSASWLDGPPVGWNTAGAPLPTAPPLQNTDPRCREREDAPSSPEENQVTGRGWKLEGYWPTLRSGNLVLVTALADYDGMCRPMEFNVFVFDGGRYAGTLSPEAMASRTDGQIAGGDAAPATVNADGTIAADFVRYADSDPLCCPSLGTTHVVYQVRQAAGGPVVNPIQIGSRGMGGGGAAVQVPSRLPVTGTLVDRPLAAGGLAGLGAVLVLLGGALRRRATKPM
jgi:LppP/LprE lipoprotein